MVLMCPRSDVMVSVRLMMIMQLFRYQYAQTPQTATDAIQYLSQQAGCKLSIKCAETLGQEMCCYDCRGCTDLLCRNHWQCCPNDIADGNGKLGGSGPLSNGVTPQCTKVFMKINSRIKEKKPDSLSYKMIATCPNSSPQQLKDLCTHNEEGPVKNLIPVMGVDKHMYRNVHCLNCNSGTQKLDRRVNLALTRWPLHQVSPFKSLKINVKSDFSMFNISAIQSTDTFVLSATLHYTNVNYSSPCDLTNDLWQCHNATVSHSSFSEACEVFGSDYNAGIGIKVTHTETRQTYMAKNIACAYCALGDKMEIANADYNGIKRCSLEHPSEPWLLMNPLLLTDDIDTENGDILTTVIVLGSEYTCGLGYFMDKVNHKCRLILCPRHHFIYQGKCHPTFTHSVGQCYHVKVKAIFSVFAPYRPNDLGEDVFDILFTDSARFVLCGVRSHEKSSTLRDTEYIVYELVFCPRAGTTYTDIIETVKPIFTPGFSVVGTYQIHPYIIMGLDHVYFTNSESVQLKDSKDKKTLKSYNWLFINKAGCGTPIPLTYVDVCYRVLMNQSAPLENRLKRLNKDYWEKVDNASAALCIEMYDRTITIRDIYSRDNDGDNGDDGTVVFFSYQIIALISGVGIFFIIGCMIWSTVTGNDVEMEDVTVTDEDAEPDETGKKQRKVKRRPVPSPWADIGL